MPDMDDLIEERQNIIRRPESKLEVIWQRHVPRGVGEADSDARVAVVSELVPMLEDALDRYAYGELLDFADLVLTLSRRP